MVVGQIEAKMLLDRSNFTQGIKLTQHETSLLIPNLQAAAKAENEVAGGATKAGGAAGFLSGQFSQLAVMAGSYLGAQVLINAAMSAFVERAAEVTAINRDIVTMEKLGISTYGARKELEATGIEFVRMGQREDAAYTSYQDLLQATGNVDRATQLLNESLRFSVMWNEDVAVVAKAVAKAYEHQPKFLSQLLAGHGLLSAKVKDFVVQEAALVKGGEGANRVISAQAEYLNSLKVAGEEAKDTFADMAWNVADWVYQMELANPLLAEMGRQMGIMPTYGLKKPGKPWEWDRSSLMRMSFTPPPTPPPTEEEIAAAKAAAEKRAAAQEEVTKKLKGLLMDEFDFRRWTEMKWFADEVNLYGNLTGLAEAHKAALAKIDEDQTESHRKAIQQWIDDEEKKAEKQAREAKQYDQEMTTQWEKDHRVQMRLLDGTGQQFKSVFVDLVSEGKFSIEDFGKSFVRMLAEIAADEAWTQLRNLIRQLWGFGAWRPGVGSGGALYEGGWESGGGGGTNVAGGGGGRPLPPMTPPTILQPQPVIVNNITVQGDVTRFAEFSEKVLNAGFNRRAALR